MKMYRVLTSETEWDNNNIIYGIEVHVRGVRVRGHRESRECVFEAENDAVAENVLGFYAQDIKGKSRSGKWAVSLQSVRVESGVVHRIRTIKTVVSA